MIQYYMEVHYFILDEYVERNPVLNQSVTVCLLCFEMGLRQLWGKRFIKVPRHIKLSPFCVIKAVHGLWYDTRITTKLYCDILYITGYIVPALGFKLKHILHKNNFSSQQ